MSAGLFGPNYSFADELATPSEIGVGRDGSFDGIMRAVGGVNYYVDAIGFGEATGLAKMNGQTQTPLGLRYFVNTGANCSNGADMYEYVDTVPPGLPGRVGKEIQKTLGVEMRGLAPGIISDAAGALNPMPLFNAITGSGYPRCRKVTLPVGNTRGQLKSAQPPYSVWITDPTKIVNGAPHQTRWVFDSYITQEQYNATQKTENAGIIPATEGFVGNTEGSKVVAGAIFAALLFGIIGWKAVR